MTSLIAGAIGYEVLQNPVVSLRVVCLGFITAIIILTTVK